MAYSQSTIININYIYLFWSGEVEREGLAAGLQQSGSQESREKVKSEKNSYQLSSSIGQASAENPPRPYKRSPSPK
jgi:hypothetical protein